jgi:hypothetical protein
MVLLISLVTRRRLFEDFSSALSRVAMGVDEPVSENSEFLKPPCPCALENSEFSNIHCE